MDERPVTPDDSNDDKEEDTFEDSAEAVDEPTPRPSSLGQSGQDPDPNAAILALRAEDAGPQKEVQSEEESHEHGEIDQTHSQPGPPNSEEHAGHAAQTSETSIFPSLDGHQGSVEDERSKRSSEIIADSAQQNGTTIKSSQETISTSTETPHKPEPESLDSGSAELNHDRNGKGSATAEDHEAASKDSGAASRTGSEPPAQETQEPPRRKLTKAFSFLTRAGSVRGKSPQKSPSGRKETVATPSQIPEAVSITPAANNVKADDNAATALKKPDRNSLKDRFKILRMQEEAGIKLVDESGAAERPSSSGHNKIVDVSTAVPPIDEEGDRVEGLRQRATSINASQPTMNQNLKPGTAAGTSAGPSEQPTPVDWDLWQAVVCEGPAAVARTSAAELNGAIAQGIPSAIRGVVWQVLAQSQSEQLELLYSELANRSSQVSKNDSAGSSNELRPHTAELKRHSAGSMNGDLKPKPQDSKRQSTSSVNGTPLEKEKESIAISSASSMHSAVSTPSSPRSEHAIPVPSPSATSQDATTGEAQEKAQAKLQAEQAKRSKDDAYKLQRLERTIRRDLGARTSYSKFLMSAGLQSGLFGICKAYALYDEEVGYAQGMNFVAMPLLFNMPEEEAFCLFVRLMNQYHLRDLFIHDMPGLHMHLYQFERLLEDFEPAVYCHLHRRGVSPQLYATQWFLTLFAYRFPLQLVLRIYDLILSEGLETAILKFGLVLMQKNADKLLEMRDMAVLTTFLKERLFDVYIDKSPSASSVLESGFFGSAGGIDKEVYRADTLVQDACAVKISTEMLKQYTSEWEERTREEKARHAELESLRSGNASLSLQVRNLEERSEKYDAEHVQIASSLVRTQLSNQTLADDNESLRTQVAELQGIVSAQPGEVEEKLRAETERIMQRNIEVQNENRHLEEGLEEMEGEFVRTKMKLAETEGELEEIKRRWMSVAGLMSAGASPRLG